MKRVNTDDSQNESLGFVERYIDDVTKRLSNWETEHDYAKSPWYLKAIYPIRSYFVKKQIRISAFGQHLYGPGRDHLGINSVSWRQHFFERLGKELAYHRQLIYAFANASPLATGIDGVALTAALALEPVSASLVMLASVGVHFGLVQMIDIANTFQNMLQNKGRKYKEVDGYLSRHGYSDAKNSFQKFYSRTKGKLHYMSETYQEASKSYREYESQKHGWDKDHLSLFQKLSMNIKIGTRIVASQFRANPGSTGIAFGLIGLIPLTAGLSMIGLPLLLIPFSFTDAAAFYKNEVKNECLKFQAEKGHTDDISVHAKKSPGWRAVFGNNIAHTISEAKESVNFQDLSAVGKLWFHVKMLGKLANSFFDVSPVTVGVAGAALGIGTALSGPFVGIPIVLGAVVCTALIYAHKKDVVIDFDKRIQETVINPARALKEVKTAEATVNHDPLVIPDAHEASVPDVSKSGHHADSAANILAEKAGELGALVSKRNTGDVFTGVEQTPVINHKTEPLATHFFRKEPSAKSETNNQNDLHNDIP